jgi:hypothetical protein
MEIDKVIHDLFSSRWTDNLAKAPIEDMKKQLHKTLIDQVNGYWSGHTAYHIAVDGGFLVDSKRVFDEGTCKAKGKKLTSFGKLFVDSMSKQIYKQGLDNDNI